MSSSKALERIRESNRQAEGAWDRWASHRERVMELLAHDATPASLCLLGPGQLNDVRMNELLQRFREVTLVDIDVQSVRSALRRHAIAESNACRLCASVDLTGILDLLAHAPDVAAARAAPIIERLRQHRCTIAGAPFDVTASTGVLTQLLQSVVDSGLGHRDVVRVSVALRDKHLLDLVHLTRPGGTGVLVTDIVSTTSAPHLLLAQARDLERHMVDLVAAHNFFTGTNPYRIMAILEQDGRFRDLVSDVRIVTPWLWPVTADRAHLTCAVVLRRRRCGVGG